MTEAPAAPGFRLAAGPAGPVEHAVTGSGDPVTLFVHGLTGSVAQTRPFGSGVPGSKVFVHLRGHGGTPVPDDGPGTVADLAAEVDAVRRETGATRAFGVSLGAAALLRLLADAARDGAPSPFERVVLALPAALDEPDAAPAGPLHALAAALDARDPGTAAGLLRDLQPAAVRRLPAVGLWARRRAAELVRAPGSARWWSSAPAPAPAATPRPAPPRRTGAARSSSCPRPGWWSRCWRRRGAWRRTAAR